MRRLVAFALVLALVLSGTALAGRGDPRERLTAADNARAKSMLLRKSDLGPTFRATPPRPEEDRYCAAIDESDLTLTGTAESPYFRAAVFIVASYADIYRTRSEANASWNRGTSAAGISCLRKLSRQELEGSNVRFVSFRQIAVPRIAERSIAFRMVGSQGGVRLIQDVIALQHSRAFAAVVFASAYAPVPREAQLRYARLVAKRMATAMRGA